MIACVGSTLLLGARRPSVPPEVKWLGASSAAALMAVDVVFVRQRRIPRIYLADAVAELGLLAGWALATIQECLHRRALRAAQASQGARLPCKRRTTSTTTATTRSR